MRKTTAVVLALFVILATLPGSSESYSRTQHATILYQPFDDGDGKGEMIGHIYRLHAKNNSYTRYAPLPKEARTASIWHVEAEITNMEGAGPGLFLIYSDRQGLGAELKIDGTLSLVYMETRRNRGISTWQIAETRLPEIKLPVRLGFSYSYHTTDYLVKLNGTTYLSGKANTSSFFPFLLEFSTIGIKSTNKLLNINGHCDFGEIVIATN